MLLLAPMMSSVGPKLRYLFPNPTWKVMVKLATYIATAPKYVLLARQIFWYAQQEQLLREECHYRDAVYGQKGQGSHHLLYWYCWTDRTWWQQILRVHRFHFASNCHMENLSNGILMLHSQTHSRPCHAVFLPFPTNADTVSQPLNAWKKGNAFDLGPSDLTNIMNWYPSQIFAFSKNHP